MRDSFSKPAEDLARSAAEYIDLKTDEVKLRMAKGLSVTLNRLLLAILFLGICNIVLLAAAFGGILLIGDLVGSWWGGAFIVAGVFIAVGLVLYMLRNRLFLNSFVRMFVRLFFDDADANSGL